MFKKGNGKTHMMNTVILYFVLAGSMLGGYASQGEAAHAPQKKAKLSQRCGCPEEYSTHARMIPIPPLAPHLHLHACKLCPPLLLYQIIVRFDFIKFV
jgi:hypothetical protein